jgi:putative addiction module component (TIGR02574 family)
MTKASRELFEQILTLPPIERATLVEEIYRSLGGDEDQNVTRAWAEEAEKRIDAYDRNQITGRDYEQVKESLQRK